MADKMNQRGAAQEAKYALDQETHFKVLSRRNKLLGQWLAARLGKPESTHAAYATEVVMADLEEPGDEDVIRKVMKDIGDEGSAITEKQIRDKLAELFDVAAREFRSP